MKNESNAPQAAPASPWWNRPRVLAVALPGTVLLAVIAGQTITHQKPAAAPAADASEPMVRLHPMSADTQQAETSGYKPTKHALIFTRNAPGTTPAQTGASQILLPKGVKRPNIARPARSAAGVGRITAGTTKAGGQLLQLGPANFPYATAQLAPGGKVDVQCESDIAVRKAQPQHPAH